MKNILASVPISTNQKSPNRNGNEAALITPMVIKPNQKTNFNQAKIVQPVSVQYTTNPIAPVAMIYNNPSMVQTMANKNIQKINQQSQIQYQQAQQAQKIQQAQYTPQVQPVSIIVPQDPPYFQQQPISRQLQPPPKPPEPPTPDEKLYNFLLTKYRKSFLISLANSVTTKQENMTSRSKQSAKNNAKLNDNTANSKTEECNLFKNVQSIDEQERITGKERIRDPLDRSLVDSYFFDKSHEETKISRLSRRQVSAPFAPQYETWTKVGHGYLVNPNPPYYYEEPHFVDFICQCKLKALATGGEGTSIYGQKDEQAPLLASNARLQFSMLVDELGIDHLKVEAKMKNAASRNPKPGTIDKLAKLYNSLETKIREYNDDFRNQYRKPLEIPYNIKAFLENSVNSNDDQPAKDYYETPENCTFPLDQFDFLVYALRMIELTSSLTPKHYLHITKALTIVFPLILKALVRPEKDWHFVGKKVHYTYFFRLFRLLNRLTEYFSQLPMIPCRATFGLINGIRSDLTIPWNKELHKISENIDYGGCLSWILCEMRDISLALTIHSNDVTMINETIKLFDRYELHHPERFLHSTSYMQLYFENDNTIKSKSLNDSFLQSKNVKHYKKSNSNEGSSSSGSIIKKASSKKSSMSYILYNNDNIKDKNVHTHINLDDNDEFDFNIDDLLKISCRENNDQNLYMIKFLLDKDGMVSFRVKQPDEAAIQKASTYFNLQTHVPPIYPFIVGQHKQKNDDEAPIYVPDDGSFRFRSAVPSKERFGRPLRINFEPYSQQSMFSLNTSHFY